MNTVKLNLDPVVICPYNSSHLIAKSRIQKHLVKCEKNYPPNFKLICPHDATHRFFEHEMDAHIETCPMKDENLGRISGSISRMPDMTNDASSIVTSSRDEWEEDKPITHPLPKEPTFEAIRPVQHVTFNAPRGNALIARRIGSTLRRPLGQSEAMMLECSDTSVKDDDTDSVGSDLSFGRGRALLSGLRVRGVGMLHRRGLRGRLS